MQRDVDKAIAEIRRMKRYARIGERIALVMLTVAAVVGILLIATCGAGWR